MTHIRCNECYCLTRRLYIRFQYTNEKKIRKQIWKGIGYICPHCKNIMLDNNIHIPIVFKCGRNPFNAILYRNYN